MGVGSTPFIRPEDFDNAFMASKNRVGDFNYKPDYNDSELLALKMRAGIGAGRRRANLGNEIGRAGLIGSSASFGLNRQLDDDIANMDYGIDQDVFGRRRAEKYDGYQRDMDRSFGLTTQKLGWQGGMENARMQYMYEKKMREDQAMQEALAGLGGVAGSWAYGGFKLPGSK